jgi:hypothetical protein
MLLKSLHSVLHFVMFGWLLFAPLTVMGESGGVADPTEGISLDSSNPEAAAFIFEQDRTTIQERDANSNVPDYWPPINPDDPQWVKAHPGWQEDPVFQARTDGGSIHSVYKYGYQTVIPGQTEESIVAQLQAPAPPAPPCPAARNTGCGTPSTCCPAGQIYTGNGCNTGQQLCCAKGTQGCTQLDCRTSTTVGGGTICATDNTTCRSSTDGTITAGKCQLVAGTTGAGTCPCL